MQEKEASENHAADESAAVDEPEKTSSESADSRKICQQPTAKPILGWKDLLLGRRVPYISKVSSSRAMWSSVLAVSAFILVSVVLLVNVWGYLRFYTAY